MLTDYDIKNLRQIGDIRHAFEAWTGETTHVIDAAEFLEYCAQTGIISQDTHIHRHGDGVVCIPKPVTMRFDAGRAEYYEQEKLFSYTFAEFFADFEGQSLHEALELFLTDTRITSG